MKKSIFSQKAAAVILSAVCVFLFPVFSGFPQDVSITVTGLRDETDINSVAGAVSVISSDDIEKSGKTSVTDLLGSVPGVSLSGMSGATRRGVSIGGYGDSSYGRVLILLDGIPLNNPDMSAPDLSWIQIASVKRIEIYKGDASALYGNQASAGVISITTKEAGKKSAFAEAGASSGKSVFGSANVTTTGDTYGISAGSTVSNERSARENNDTYTGTAGLSGFYDLTDMLTVHADIQAFNDRYGMPAYTRSRDSTSANDTKSYAKDAGVFMMLNPVLTISGKGRLTVPVSYLYKSTDSLTLSSYNYASKVGRHQLSLRPDFTWRISDSLKIYTAFDNSFVNVGSETGYDSSFDALEDDDNSTDNHMKTFNTAPVARVTFNAGAFQFEGTGRYDYYKVSYTNSADADISKSYQSPVWQASILYHMPAVKDFVSSAYASFGSIFRYPFTDEMGSFYGYSTDSFNDLKAESGYSARIGYKGSFRKGNFDMYGGWSTTDNEIVYDASAFANINMDPVNRWTAGINASYTPVDMLVFTAGYTYANAVFTEDEYKDNTVPLVSDHSITAGVTVKPADFLSAGTTIRVDSPYYLATDFSNSQDKEPWSYDLGFNASVRVTKDCTLFAFASNVLEKAKANYAGYSSSSGIYYYPCEGRSLTLKARIAF